MTYGSSKWPPQEQPLTVEVCVVTYGSEESIERCARSLVQLGSGVRLAIHDNSDPPLHFSTVRHRAAALGMPLRVERCGGNCGFSRACNSLARRSTSDLLLFLNPDAELLNWPSQLTTSTRGIIGPQLVDDRNRALVTWGKHRTIAAEFLLRWARVRPRMPVGDGYVSGASLLVPRRTFLRLGGFDERFFMYYEDIDFCSRANRAGMSVTAEPAWKVRHTGGHAAHRDYGRALIRSYESANYFFAKRGESVSLYRLLCRIDAYMRLALFTLVPSRRALVPAIRQFASYLGSARPEPNPVDQLAETTIKGPPP